MSNSRFFLSIIGLAICVLSQVEGNVQYPNIDEETGCPIGVNDACEYCAEDQNRLGCYCELSTGETFVTANIFTACPANNSDPCSSSPCQNGATCVQQGLTGFRCNCASGFGGATCNITFPKCSDAGIDCPNGECVETNNPLLPVYCQCYDGTRRDPRGNDSCPFSPCYERDSEVPVCKNNGTCRILNNVYLCECTAGWAGVNCTRALKTPLCESQPGVCGTGRCVQSLSPPFYTCNCGNFPSTFGKTITELVKCEESGCFAANPCQNGGICTNKGLGAFSCQCPPRFTGSKCERNSACFNNPCLNGATCEAFNETSFFCKCPRYFTGQRCEIAVPDPCKSKNCGPFGVCEDNQGVAVCRCANGLSLNGLPCEDPCKTRNCSIGVCTRKPNATFEAVCSCPVSRKGEFCEEPNDPCRSGARCGGGYCKTDPRAPRGFTCVCEGGIVKNEPCPFSRNCPIRDCGTEGVCVETDGLVPTPGSRPIFYVCTCKNGYIAANDCNGLVNVRVPAAAARCGPNGYPYPSRNPNNPIGCWCNNGTQIEEIRDDGITTYCP